MHIMVLFYYPSNYYFWSNKYDTYTQSDSCWKPTEHFQYIVCFKSVIVLTVYSILFTLDIFRLSWIKIRSYTSCDHHLLCLYTGFDYWVTRRVPLVKQELLNVPEHMNSSWLLFGSCYSILSSILARTNAIST